MGKMYYTIGEVAEIIGESTSLVRFWSGKFSEFIKPARNKKGNRLFTAEDVANYKIIHHLVKDRGHDTGRSQSPYARQQRGRRQDG